MADNCQVDFYVLANEDLSAGQLACRLSLMAWEKGHHVTVRAENEQQAKELDALMWDFPSGRFLPHSTDPGKQAPVYIAENADLSSPRRDLLVNLAESPVPQPGAFQRVLEIVPANEAHRNASRHKFRSYRQQGLNPETHPIAK